MIAHKIAFSAVIAAIYIVISLMTYQFSFGAIQLRLAEAMTVLPFLSPLAIPGLFVGCLISNIFGGFGMIDIVFGSLATLLAGILTARMPAKWLAPVPPVIVNALIVGAILTYALSPDNFLAAYPFYILSIAISQTAVCFCFGIPLLMLVQKHAHTGLDVFDRNNIWAKKS